MRVGFTGLGVSAPMALGIVEGGFETALWARRPSSRTVRRYGSQIASSPPSSRAAIWYACAVGDADVKGSARRRDSVLADSLPAASSPSIPRYAPTRASRSRNKLLHRVFRSSDAPVSGEPAVQAGTLLVMVGGDSEIVERVQPVFATYADPIAAPGRCRQWLIARFIATSIQRQPQRRRRVRSELGEALGVPRPRRCTVITRGSYQQALSSIAMFSSTLD